MLRSPKPVRTLLAVAALVLLPSSLTSTGRAASGLPTVSEVLTELQFTPAEIQRVKNDELVRSNRLRSSNERELVVAMAFLRRKPTSELVDEFLQQTDYGSDPGVTAFGVVSDDPTLADFRGLRLEPNRDAMAQEYLAAAPGTTLNLDASEIEAFRSLAKSGKGTPAKVEQTLHRLLLRRASAYKKRGLAGIAPYQRARGPFQPGEDLRRATEAARPVAEYADELIQTLLEYPDYRAPGLRENFLWVNFEVDGKPTIVLTHRMALALGENEYIAADRHYYVGRSHNSVQALGGLLPVEEGSVIVYVNRTSTDQVAGFGSSARQKVGRELMGRQIASIFERVRKE